MTTGLKKKIFLLVFCLASITQGMYSTYFVSILTTIERIHQIQSKTAGAILSATEIGQILGSLFIAHYGGRGNKPKWISVCMTLSAFAALISISPHFILLTTNNVNHLQASTYIGETVSSGGHLNRSSTNNVSILSSTSSSSSSIALATVPETPYQTSDLNTATNLDLRVRDTLTTAPSKVDGLPSFDQLCRLENYTDATASNKNTTTSESMHTATTVNSGERIPVSDNIIDLPENSKQKLPVTIVIAIFSTCLLAIGFGSTAITTLGIPFIDDIISREESPLYLGLTIGLRIFGPALGFLLGSFCIRLNANSLLSNDRLLNNQLNFEHDVSEMGAWWLGLIVISLPLLVLAIPMYFLSRVITSNGSEKDDYEDITYQAAEDHDIGGSHDLPAHVLGLTTSGDPDITSNRTCFSSEIDSSSHEVLQICRGYSQVDFSPCAKYNHNIAFEQPILSSECMMSQKQIKLLDDQDALRQAGINELDENRTITNKDVASDWRAPNACLVVNRCLNDLESTSFSNENDEQANIRKYQEQQQHKDPEQQQQQQQQARGSLACIVPQSIQSTRSSIASTMSGSFVNGKNKLKRKQYQQQIKDKSTMGDLSSSLSRLLKNRLLVLRMLSGVLHILPIAGFYTFLPKYLIEQFRITSSSASAISGLAGILFVGFGAFIGGTIIRLFNVNSRMMTRWIATSAFLYAFGMLILMNLDCKQNQIVHFNSERFVSTDCSLSCKCSISIYNPVCANGTTFVSPCLAGCKAHTITEGRVIYDECGCLPLRRFGALNESSLHDQRSLGAGSPETTETSTEDAKHVNLNIATQGQCMNKCDNLIWYVILFSIFTLIHASCEVGSMMFNLRCVKSDDRTLALGLITFSSSLLGTIPCSIIYGTVVDLTCVHWDLITTTTTTTTNPLTEPDARGACRAYDNDSFRYYLHGLTAMAMSLAFIIDCIISSRANEVDFYEGADESKMDIRIGLKKSTETMQ